MFIVLAPVRCLGMAGLSCRVGFFGVRLYSLDSLHQGI